jgi:succinate dehydrogenase / fumarate reductase cytochrome b subunit
VRLRTCADADPAHEPASATLEPHRSANSPHGTARRWLAGPGRARGCDELTMENVQKIRPKYLDLFSIRLPVPGWVSILHRISGFGLFLFLPFLLWLLDNSLHSRSSFARFQAVLSEPLVKLIVLGLIWAFLHHLFAGLRHIALDLDWGVDLETGRTTAKLVLIASLALTAVLGAMLW